MTHDSSKRHGLPLVFRFVNRVPNGRAHPLLRFTSSTASEHCSPAGGVPWWFARPRRQFLHPHSSLAAWMFTCGLLVTADAFAKPNYRTSFFNLYPTASASRLATLPSAPNHCGVCHFAFGGGGPRNPYGEEVELALQSYPNTESGRQQAIASIENNDSDVDGFSNLLEITDLTNYTNTPTFPGLTSGNVNSTTGVTLAEITPYLTPTALTDTEAPVVTVLSPNGGNLLEGRGTFAITWYATDNVGVSRVDVFYRDTESTPWTQIADNLANTGSIVWHVHDTPTTQARVRVEARDAANNVGLDQSDAVFTISHPGGGIVSSTLRDFHQPGTQPFDAGTDFPTRQACSGCHGNYDQAVEPDFNYQGTMMAQAARDPLFKACLAIAEQDAPGSGDLCLRCHTPGGWMSGRSNPTDGSELTQNDRDGVGCITCHRMLDPDYDAGTDPEEDAIVLQALDEVPANYSNGQFVVDPEDRRRGPYSDAAAPHTTLYSPVHSSGDFCGTCHDVSNPVFARTGNRDYAPNAMDAASPTLDSGELFPLERTYSEWKSSSFNTPQGVYAPEFAGNKPGGFVSTCQDCHMRDVTGKGCNDVDAVTRTDLPLHDLTGGNTWMPPLIAQLYPSEVNLAALNAAADRARQMLSKSAVVDVLVAAEGDSFRATVTVTNRTGHKLPTGYPEGRRMWLHVIARDLGGQTVYESGRYESGTGLLEHDPDAKIYESIAGISPALAQAIGENAGESFHFALNDTILKDNRIPPLGFTNANYSAFGGQPVDPDQPGVRYADGQNWDTATYGLPSSSRQVVATLYYQTTSKDYIDFLRDENNTNSAGQDMHDLWTANAKAPPVKMTADSTYSPAAEVVDSNANEMAALTLVAAPNPFAGELALQLQLSRPTEVTFEVFDLQGRRVHHRFEGLVAAGAYLLRWDGRYGNGHEAGSGIFFARVSTPRQSLERRMVRLR